VSNLIYKPPENIQPPLESKICVKFSNNIYFSESFLKQNNIEYTQEDLEDTAVGNAYVVKKELEIGKNLKLIERLHIKENGNAEDFQ
jgi:hypothetical protein